jgi:hypothetical protein
VAEAPCPHCGQAHDAAATTCPTTGAPLPRAEAAGAPASEAPAPSADAPKPTVLGVFDLLKDAYALYRRHARTVLVTCAIAFVPASLVKSCAYAAVTAPTVTAEATVEAIKDMKTDDLQATQRALQEAYAQHADAKTIQRLQAEQTRLLEEIGRRSMLAASAAMGSFTAFILGVLGTLITTFFVFGLVVPLTNGALTIFVADATLGGAGDWRFAWNLLWHRVGPLLMTVIPAACLIAFGFILFWIPGLVLGLLFAFVAPVVLLEGKRGRAALRRSIDLVGPDWLRVALMIVSLAVLNVVAQTLVAIFIPRSAPFVGAVLSDLVTMVFLPLPVMAMALLYFDIRRKREGFDDARLRAELDALKAA